MAIEMIEESQGFHAGTSIMVLGVGGGGGNAVQHMIDHHVQGVEFICANTDSQALSRCSAPRTIQLGTTGLGAGARPEKGREAAEAAEADIRNALQGANMLFVTAGMGGGTGTGAAPVVARIAREMGILTVGVVTKPFDWEGTRRMQAADTGVSELEANVDSLIVVLNEKLQEVLGDDVTQEEAFAHANDVLKNAVGGIAEIINVPGQINADFEDVKAVMSSPGKAMMGTATASGPDRARIAAEQAVACPLLEGIDLSGAKGVLVLITAAKGKLKLKESGLVMETIRNYAAPDALTIYGTAISDELGDELRVTVVATGLTNQGVRRAAAPMQVVSSRTGTDDAIAIPVYGKAVAAPHAATAVPAPAAAPAMTNVSPSGNVGVSVWGNGRDRTQASERVNQLSSSGLHDYEIPAILRKQAD